MIVHYKVKEGRIAEKEAFISRAFEQLQELQPLGIRYATLKLRDGVSFVHFVSVETANGSNPLSELPAFKAFTASASERLEGQPLVTQLKGFRSYRLSSDGASIT